MSTGYLYRVTPADAARIGALVAEHVGFPCMHVGGSLLWDVGKDEAPALRSFARAGAAAELNLKGDLGSIFNARAELRWKRCDDGNYDLLLLSKQELALSADEAQPLGAGWMTRTITILIRPRRDETQDSERKPIPLKAIEYCAPNGAVQFVRYAEVRDDLS